MFIPSVHHLLSLKISSGGVRRQTSGSDWGGGRGHPAPLPLELPLNFKQGHEKLHYHVMRFFLPVKYSALTTSDGHSITVSRNQVNDDVWNQVTSDVTQSRDIGPHEVITSLPATSWRVQQHLSTRTYSSLENASWCCQPKNQTRSVQIVSR